MGSGLIACTTQRPQRHSGAHGTAQHLAFASFSDLCADLSCSTALPGSGAFVR